MSRPDAASRLRRLLAILPWIAANQGSTIDEIAERFAVPVGELERDLELVPLCGLPPYTPDRLVDLSIVDGMVTVRFAEHFDRPLRLSAAEGFALLAAARALLAVPGSDPKGPLASAVAKLERTHGLEAGVTVEVDDSGALDALREATADNMRVEIDYYSLGRDATTTRRIDPLAVFYAEGQWYCSAYCHTAGDERLFRVDRIHEIRPTGERFESPLQEPSSGEGTDPVVFHPKPTDPRVTVVVPPEAAWIADTYPVEDVQRLDEGGFQVTFALSERAWLERLLLRVGAEARVTAPSDLIDAGREAARRTLSRYR